MIKYYGEVHTSEENICTYEFCATGHANYDEYGKDIVCAAVSILVVTLANRLNELNVKGLEIKLIPGDFSVKCLGHVCDFRIKDAFEFAMLGMSLIANEHRDYVVFEDPKKGVVA